MADYDNNLKGVLFRDSGEGKSDYNGSCEINGVHYWVNGYKKMSKGGKPYTSLTFKKKEEKKGISTAPTAPPVQKPLDPVFNDDDIPF
jgi:hypothetical protein